MTKDAIEGKLRRQFLSKSTLTEARVVYILIQTRKLVDHLEAKLKFPTLWFCCSWVAHIEMERGMAKTILKYFDEAHPFNVKNQPVPDDVQRNIEEIIKFDNLRQEFLDFLAGIGISNIYIQKHWAKFLGLYAAVVEDCPLIIKGKGTKSVQSLTLQLHKPIGRLKPPHHRIKHYLLNWTYIGKDGTSGSFDVYNSIP